MPDCKWPKLASQFLWPGPLPVIYLLFSEHPQILPDPASSTCHPQTFLQHLKKPFWPHSFLLGHLEQLSLILPFSRFLDMASSFP